MTLSAKICLSLFFLLMLPIEALPADDLPDKFELAGVAFQGVESVSQEELIKTLAARTPPIWKFWQPLITLEKEDIEDDINRIRQFYRSEGYFRSEASVSFNIVGHTADRDLGKDEPADQNAKDRNGDDQAPTPRLPRVKLTFSVIEGSPVRVESIRVDISPPIEDKLSRSLDAEMPLQPGQVFRTADYEESKRLIARALGKRGYPFIQVSGQAVIDPAVDQAKLTFQIDPGLPAVFGPITITQEGAEVSEKVIRRALAFKEGERYNVEKVDTSRRNLIRLDVFRTALILPEGPPVAAGGPVPMTIQLKSKDRRSVRFGAGYGSEDRFRFQAALTYRNLAGQGGLLSLSGRISDIVRTVQMTYTQPYFLDAKNTLTARAGNEKEDPPAYANNKIFADVAVSRKIKRDWLMRLNYGLSSNIQERVAASPVRIEELEFLDRRTRISSAGMVIARDTRNDLLNPTSGTYLGAGIEAAPEFFGSELAYYQPSIEANKYQQVVGNFVLAGRINLQTIQGMQGTTYIPAFKRLYLGGSDSVRGYGFQELPPLNQNGEPLGGQTAFNASIEARFPLYKKLSGVAFLDAGLLDVEPFQLDFADTRYACGAGLRYNTVIGPIRLDFGYKLNPLTGKDIGNLDQPDDIVDGRWRIYINIGQAF